jgi:hypothetical protein
MSGLAYPQPRSAEWGPLSAGKAKLLSGSTKPKSMSKNKWDIRYILGYCGSTNSIADMMWWDDKRFR